MAHLVVAYPKLSKEDFDWIQEYRSKNDPRYFSVVKPHFSIVFPVFDMAQEEFIAEIKKQANGCKKFSFKLKAATLNRDSFEGFYHEFLVPDEGNSDFVKLHDRMYADKLRNQLRLDIDFIPHIGIGNTDAAETSKDRIDKLNAQEIDIEGTIDTLDIIEYAEGPVRTIERIFLV